MKKTYKLLAFLILPLQAIAQPVLNNAAYYSTNTVLRRVVCEPVAPGPSGANQIWDFSQLIATGDTMVGFVMPSIAGNPFPSPDFAIHDPGANTYTHFLQTGTETQQWGIIDSTNPEYSIINTDPILTLRRPLTYGDTATDIYFYSTSNTGFPVLAWGDLSYEADAYGTLYLPNDTFTNTVRVRMVYHQQDSLIGLGNLYYDYAFYVWYSDESVSPVLRVDSISITGVASLQTVDVKYLLKEADLADVEDVLNAGRLRCSAYLSDNGLLVNGSLENGKQYEVGLFGINGQQVYKSHFVASGTEQRFAIDNTLGSGTYIVTIRRKGDMGSFNTIKVVKQ